MTSPANRRDDGPRTVVILALVAAVTVIPARATSSDGSAEEATYRITLRNTTQGQYFTPPNFASHDSDARVFQRSRVASAGVQAVAENGGWPLLAAELNDRFDATGEGVSGVATDAPISPGEEVTFDVTTTFPRLSIVSMLICTNDGFGGISNYRLPTSENLTRFTTLEAFDAGTEVNTELLADIVPAPFCGGSGEGTDQTNPALAENDDIGIHGGITGVGDLGANFDFGRDVAEISVTRLPATPTYTVTYTNLTTGQYMTPPNVALHDGDATVFARRAPASPGVQAVAENGRTDILEAELQANIDDADRGVSLLVPGTPIEPGDSRTFQLTGDGDHFSLVSMLICTNDGFAGVNARQFSLREGHSLSFELTSHDAGTEVNTELLSDIVPAPFCGGSGEGTDQTNPALAQNDVIRSHERIQGVGDLGPAFSWGDTVARVTIVRN